MTRRVPARSTGYTRTHNCGYHHTARTRALADHGLRRHNCDHQRMLAARQTRVETRRNDPGTHRDCPHNGRHNHGTRAAYVFDKCTCRPCRDANTTYRNATDKRQAHVRQGAANPLTVPIAEARSVLQQLRGIGWSTRQIAAHADLERSMLQRIEGGTHRPVRRVRYATHAKLVALLDHGNPPLADGAIIDATRTWELIRALIAYGYPKSWIARHAGLGRSIQINPYTITAGNARKISDLAATTVTAGPSNRARAYAEARGWTIDALFEDPQYQIEENVPDPADLSDIDEVAIERYLSGDNTIRLTRDERQAAYAQLRDRHLTHQQACQRLNASGRVATLFFERYEQRPKEAA